MVKVWRSSANAPQNWGSLKFLRNWTKTIFQWLIFSHFANIWCLVWWKCIIWAKSDFQIINSVYEKIWFTINGPSKMVFFNFCHFHFSKFQISIVKIFWKSHPFFNGFRKFLCSSTTSQLFLMYKLGNG